ncbi:Na+/H+ antiporter subunit G [Alteromonas halophila]|uniref:Monovalent cation/H+ antiporter subunit G n=1 Tax=Alteromonas halophila TaxID=516698 RepID=A0A918JJF7_9ALTE|nr:Na+/H+ antiporter subunit G [Alteromonas halophila]GGW83191.1 monovalent cation/H+ antiporter subunit G [Alteromonas halophila]
MSFWVEVTVSVLLLIGGTFVLVGSIGLLRLKDIYCRLHGPTKATTVGLGGILIGSVIYMSHLHGYLTLHELLITLFLVITAPVTAMILAKVAMHHRAKMMDKTRNQHMVITARAQRPPETENEADDTK